MDSSAIETFLHSGTQTAALDATDERSTEERLIDALDEAALNFIVVLADNTQNEDGNYRVDFDLRMEVFKMAMQWVATRRRTKIDDNEHSQRGVKEMQQRMEAGRVATPAPELIRRGPGRPTKAETERRRIEAEEQERRDAETRKHDDSGLRHRLATVTRGQS